MATDCRLGNESSRGDVPKEERNGSDPGSDARKTRTNGEVEQRQGKTSQQLVLPAQGGLNEGTSASSMELDLPRVRGAHGECGGREFRYSKGPKKISVKYPEESTFDGRRSLELSAKKKNKRKTAKVETLICLKQTARERTQELLKNQLKRKEEKVGKKGRKSDRRPRARQVWENLEDGSFSLCCWGRTGFVSTLQPKDYRKERR